MNDQERKIISDIFARLEGTAGQARDAEAERFIAEKVKAQPYAPYAMAQALYVQEEAMKSLNTQLDQLKAENEGLRQKASGSGGGIFSSLFGGGAREQPPAPRPGPGFGQQPGYAQQPGYPQQGGPWGGQPAGYPPQGGYPQQGGPWSGQPQQQQGGGFLRGALTTAAGVAGGMVVGNALMNAFSGGHHSTLGSLSSSDMASMGFDPSTSSSVQDASFGDGGGVFGGGGSGGGYQDANFSDGGGVFSDPGSSAGGVQDANFGDSGGVFNDASSGSSLDDGGVDFGGGDDSWN